MRLYWRFFQTAVIFPLIVIALGSCTFLGSHNLQHLGADQKLDANGVYYALPKGVVEFQLHYVAAEGRYVLTHSPVQYIPDPELEFNLQYQPLPNYEDEITVQVGRNSLIKKIHSTTDDKTPDVVVNVAKAFKAFSGFESQKVPANSPLIIQKIIDPTQDQEVQTLMREFNDAIAENKRQLILGCETFAERVDETGGIYLEEEAKKKKKEKEALEKLMKLMSEKEILLQKNKKIAENIANNIPKGKTLSTERQNHRENTRRIAELEREVIEAKNKYDASADAVAAFKNVKTQTTKACNGIKALPTFKVHIHLDNFQISEPSIQPVSFNDAFIMPDCTQGVCYRPKEPYRLEYGLYQTNGKDKGWVRQFKTSIIELPNRAMPVLIDLRRAFFVKKVHNIEFDANGFLQLVKIDKPSELEAVSSLPVEVLKAVSEGLTLRVNLLNKQRDAAKKEAELIKSKADFRQFQAQFESARK